MQKKRNMENNINTSSLDKPIWTLTASEFLTLQNKAIEAALSEIISKELRLAKEDALPKSDTMGVDETAGITRYSPKTLYSKVCRREIPRVSSGRPLIFSRKEIEQWMKLGKPTVAEMALMRRNGEL
jgi:predicted DNA-binding transcriptional regulator AlpA